MCLYSFCGFFAIKNIVHIIGKKVFFVIHLNLLQCNVRIFTGARILEESEHEAMKRQDLISKESAKIAKEKNNTNRKSGKKNLKDQPERKKCQWSLNTGKDFLLIMKKKHI